MELRLRLLEVVGGRYDDGSVATAYLIMSNVALLVHKTGREPRRAQ
jgi:hypothetical protein